MPPRGRYNLLRKIADGGTAEVFLAHMEGSAGFKRLVVLKRVRPSLWADEAFRQALIDEAHIAMGLHHSNIVQVLDLGVAAERYFLAFELVDGWTLSQVVKRARLAKVPIPLKLTLHIMGEVCRALAYAHSRAENGVPLQIVHRDVSPQNVLLSEQGEVKLTDFGIARARIRATVSQIGSVKGKPAFMSPEQAAGNTLDARSDLFPIGTMIYQLVTGELPFTGASALEEMAKVVAAKFTPPTTLRPDLPKELAALISKTLERKPDRRYQSAEELLHAIEKLQRTVLEPAGTSELKGWLGALAEKDKVLPLSRHEQAPAPIPLNPSTDVIELQDEDVVLTTSPSQKVLALPPSEALVLPPAPTPSTSGWRIAGAVLIAAIAVISWAPWRTAPPEPVEPAQAPVVAVPAPAPEAEAVDAGVAEELPPPPPTPEPAVVEAEPAFAAPPLVEVPGEPPPTPRPAPQPSTTTDAQVSVLIESEPAGAEVRIDRRLFGTTPVPLKLKIGIAFELTLSKSGYREQKVLHFVTRKTTQKVRVTLAKGN